VRLNEEAEAVSPLERKMRDGQPAGVGTLVKEGRSAAREGPRKVNKCSAVLALASIAAAVCAIAGSQTVAGAVSAAPSGHGPLRIDVRPRCVVQAGWPHLPRLSVRVRHAKPGVHYWATVRWHRTWDRGRRTEVVGERVASDLTSGTQGRITFAASVPAGLTGHWRLYIRHRRHLGRPRVMPYTTYRVATKSAGCTSRR